MKLLLNVILICIFNYTILGQQEQQYSQYLINPFTINPAVSSTEDYIDVQSGYRAQWNGLEGSPKTAYATAYKTLGKPFYHLHHAHEHKNWHGIGMHIYNDQTGPIQRNALLLAYSYNMPLFKKTRLSFGSFMGIKRLKTNSDYWKDIEDNTDILFSQDQSSGVKPEIQLGAVMYSENYFFTLAAHNLVAKNIKFSSTEAQGIKDYKTHLFLSGGYIFRTSEKVKITPSVLMKYVVNAPISLDLNMKIDHNSKYWYGTSARIKESVNIFAGVRLKSLIDITYAFEWSLSKLNSHNSGTHEIILGLRLKHPNIVLDPSRYW